VLQDFVLSYIFYDSFRNEMFSFCHVQHFEVLWMIVRISFGKVL